MADWELVKERMLEALQSLQIICKMKMNKSKCVRSFYFIYIFDANRATRQWGLNKREWVKPEQSSGRGPCFMTEFEYELELAYFTTFRYGELWLWHSHLITTNNSGKTIKLNTQHMF